MQYEFIDKAKAVCFVTGIKCVMGNCRRMEFELELHKGGH